MLASGASPCSRVYQQFASAGLTIWEGYGMTSCAVSSLLRSSRVSQARKWGHPLPGVETKLIDDPGNEVEEGDPGDHRPRPNLQRYWPDGSEGPDADGWLVTGDVAIADHDGDLRLVDRRRDLILVSGFNVYHARSRALSRLLRESLRLPSSVSRTLHGRGSPATCHPTELISNPRIALKLQVLAFKAPTIVEVVRQLPHSVTEDHEEWPLGTGRRCPVDL